MPPTGGEQAAVCLHPSRDATVSISRGSELKNSLGTFPLESHTANQEQYCSRRGAGRARAPLARSTLRLKVLVPA
jgi:hypothetical protein